MTLNIALNTIIIIMVFLFPGIIARKRFFSGTFKNRYENGNVLDKLVWNILVSVICLFLFSIIHTIFFYLLYKINIYLTLTNIHLPKYKVGYDDVYCIFQSLSKNELPPELGIYSKFILLFIHLILVYAFSFFIGEIAYKCVKKYKLERRLSFIQFSNHWEYLSTPNIYNFSDIDPKKNYDTWVDVMVGEKDKNELFRGIVEKMVYDKENKLEHILLQKTIQFVRINIQADDIIDKSEPGYYLINKKRININTIHIETGNKIVLKKVIDGKIFVIPANNIKNLNFTYTETQDKTIPFTEKKNEKTSLSKNVIENKQTNIISAKLFFTNLVFIIISSIYYLYGWYINNLIDFDSAFIHIIVRVIKGFYLIILFIILIFTIINIISKKHKFTSTNRLISLSILILFSIPLFSMLYDIHIIYSLSLVCFYLTILEITSKLIIRSKQIGKYADKISFAIGLLFIITIYYFLIKTT